MAVPAEVALPVSYSSGMFKLADLVLEPFNSALRASTNSYECIAPRLSPALGAVFYAAICYIEPFAETNLPTINHNNLSRTT